MRVSAAKMIGEPEATSQGGHSHQIFFHTLTLVVPSGLGQPLLESAESSPWVEVSDDGSEDICSQTSASADDEVIEQSSERYQFYLKAGLTEQSH